MLLYCRNGATPFLGIFSSPSDRDYKNAEDILQDLDILDLKNQLYTEISGGERQLVLIARTLMQNPKVLLLDEPVTHLDLRNKVKVLGTIKRIAQKGHLTVVATLHDPNDAIFFSDRIALLKKRTDPRIWDTTGGCQGRHAAISLRYGTPDHKA